MTDEATETTTEEASTEAPPPEAAETPAEGEAAPPAEEKTPEQVAAEQASARREARISRAAAAERSAAEARESRRVRQEISRAEQERQRVAQDRQAWEAQRQADAEAIRKGGLEALKARGLDYAQLTREYIDQSSPEAQERAKVARELEETKKQLAELTTAQQRANAEKAYAEIESALERNADQYPFAYELSPGVFRASVGAIARSMLASGRQPTHSSVLKTLDETVKADHDVREQRRSALAKRTGGSQPSQSTSRNATTATRTLTSQDAAQRASTGGRPKTDAELDDEIARAIRPMLRTAD